MDGINIVIPSFGRAGRVKGYDYFFDARIVIPAHQADAYKRYYGPDRLIVIPDEQDGVIARKRNWILDNIPRPLIMIDDDVSHLTTTEGIYDKAGRFMGRSNQKIRLNSAQAAGVIVQGFILAADWGVPIWGIGVNTDGRNYQQFRPFALTQIVLGPFQGHLDHGIRFDERMGTKEDYDMSLQCLERYRKILRINKYAYYCEHGTNPGGIVGGRTLASEVGFAEAIEKKWGRGIIRYEKRPKKLSEILNGNVTVPIAGV